MSTLISGTKSVNILTNKKTLMGNTTASEPELSLQSVGELLAEQIESYKPTIANILLCGDPYITDCDHPGLELSFDDQVDIVSKERPDYYDYKFKLIIQPYLVKVFSRQEAEFMHDNGKNNLLIRTITDLLTDYIQEVLSQDQLTRFIIDPEEPIRVVTSYSNFVTITIFVRLVTQVIQPKLQRQGLTTDPRPQLVKLCRSEYIEDTIALVEWAKKEGIDIKRKTKPQVCQAIATKRGWKL